MNLFSEIYELAADYRSLAEMLDDPEADASAALDTLEGIQAEFSEKADNVACMVKELEAKAKAIKAEGDRLLERAAQKQAKAKKLREFLAAQMSLANMKKLETARNVMVLRAAPGALKLQDQEAFLAWCKAERRDLLRERELEIDKNAVRDALKTGASLPGASLEKGTSFVLR